MAVIHSRYPFQISLIPLITLLTFIIPSSSAADPLVVSLSHSVFENTISIEVTLENAHFATIFQANILVVSLNTNNAVDTRSMSSDFKSIYMDITITESVQDLEITVKLPSCCVSTQEQILLSSDFVQKFIAGTFLPNCPRMSLKSAINFIQNSVIFIILRMVPIHLVLFTHIQGILVLLLSDINLPQKFYEFIRTYCSFAFESINPWQLSNSFTPDMQAKTLFRSKLQASTTTLHISQIGFQENFFAQTIGPAMVLIALWGAWYICKFKGFKLFQLQIVNCITILHKTTLMLFSIFMFQQLRMLGNMNGETISIMSVIAAFGMIGYFLGISILIFRMTQKKNIPGQDESIEERVFFKLSSSMRCYFYLPQQYDSGSIEDHKQPLKQVSDINRRFGGRSRSTVVKWFPLISTYFKIYISFILVFFQGIGYIQMALLLISYGFYGILTFRYFLVPSGYSFGLKIAQQIFFFLLLIISLVNHIIIEHLLTSVPQSGSSVSLSDDSYDNLSAIQIVQFLLITSYIFLSLLNKLIQFKSLFKQSELRLYDSQERLYLSKKQITEISHVLLEMIAQQKQTQQNEDPKIPLAKTLVWQSMREKYQSNSKRGSYQSSGEEIKDNKDNQSNSNDIQQNIDNDIQQNIDNDNQNKDGRNKNNNKIKLQSQSKQYQEGNEINAERDDNYHNELNQNLTSVASRNSKQQYDSQMDCKKSTSHNDWFVRQGTTYQPSSQFIPSVHRLVLRETNQENNQQQQLQKQPISNNLNESDIDDFSSVQRVLNMELPQSSSTSFKQLENLMKETATKVVFLSGEQHQILIKFMNQQVLNTNNPSQSAQTASPQQSPIQYFSGDSSSSFKNAKLPVSLLIRNETVRKIKNLYGSFKQNDEIEFSNFIENIQDATVVSKNSPINISTKYSCRNFVISQNSFKRFEELIKLFQNHSTSTLSITTRIFFDLEQYSLNQSIQFNSHPSFSLSFPKS